jgi:hypothetical protein
MARQMGVLARWSWPIAQRLLFCNSGLDKSITAPSFVGYIDLPKRLECPVSSRDRLCCD